MPCIPREDAKGIFFFQDNHDPETELETESFSDLASSQHLRDCDSTMTGAPFRSNGLCRHVRRTRPLFYAATHVGHGGYTHKSPPPFAFGAAGTPRFRGRRRTSPALCVEPPTSRLLYQAVAWPSAATACSTAKSPSCLTSTVSRGADSLPHWLG